MRRLKNDTIELNPTEAKAYDRWEQLLDEGHSCASAADIVRKEFELAFHFITFLTGE